MGFLAVVRTGGSANSSVKVDGKRRSIGSGEKAARHAGEPSGLQEGVAMAAKTGLDAKEVLWKSARDGQQLLEQKFDPLMRS
ncbi:hypothetical protein NL676_026295 [Syzygium grande]|nr:hypothetical protein NL676_026295 [Syzygium grande]